MGALHRFVFLGLGAVLASACAGDPTQGGSTTGINPTSAGPGETSDADGGPATMTASGGDSTGEPEGFCGDAVLDEGEECDLGSANGPNNFCREDCIIHSCPDGVEGPGEACDVGWPACMNDPDCKCNCASTDCGNGEIEPGEQCDLAGENSNTGECTEACMNPICGDTHRNGDEMCDGIQLGGANCQTEGFDGGTLFCSLDCMGFDTDDCNFTCGNEVINDGTNPGPEQCDGSNLGGLTCATLGGLPFDDGVLACNNCMLDTSACTQCGDNVVEGNEQCESGMLGDADCTDFGTFDDGNLACNGNCRFNTNGCTDCGDGVREGNEECDMSDGLASCNAGGPQYGPGTAACDSNCDDDFSACCIVQGFPCQSATDCCDSMLECSGPAGAEFCCKGEGMSCDSPGECCSNDCGGKSDTCMGMSTSGGM